MHLRLPIIAFRDGFESAFIGCFFTASYRKAGSSIGLLYTTPDTNTKIIATHRLLFPKPTTNSRSTINKVCTRVKNVIANYAVQTAPLPQSNPKQCNTKPCLSIPVRPSCISFTPLTPSKSLGLWSIIYVGEENK